MLFKIEDKSEATPDFFTVPTRSNSELEEKFWAVPQQFGQNDTRDSVLDRTINLAIVKAKQHSKDTSIKLLKAEQRTKSNHGVLVAKGARVELWAMSTNKTAASVARRFAAVK